jgi:hypothetical protein
MYIKSCEAARKKQRELSHGDRGSSLLLSFFLSFFPLASEVIHCVYDNDTHVSGHSPALNRLDFGRLTPQIFLQFCDRTNHIFFSSFSFFSSYVVHVQLCIISRNVHAVNFYTRRATSIFLLFFSPLFLCRIYLGLSRSSIIRTLI